jgi:glycosyltransferase involved in cell wall biosynthesis
VAVLAVRRDQAVVIVKPKVSLVHYSAPPVVGGVEAVMQAHARLFLQAGYPVEMIAGRGDQAALPEGACLRLIPELDTQYPAILRANIELEAGKLPVDWDVLVQQIYKALASVISGGEVWFVHNVLSKHFNLPFTAAVAQLVEQGAVSRCVAWCHDLTWTSSNSRSKVFPGYPWDLLRQPQANMHYITISTQRQAELAGLFGLTQAAVQVVPNGVDPVTLLALSALGSELISTLDLFAMDLVALMPVRVTNAKNIEFAIQVAAALKEKGISARMIITGPPDPHDEANMDYYHRLLDLRKQMDVDEQVRFIYETAQQEDIPDWLPAEVVSELFRVADVMFMPSHREGFGMPVLEAGLLGLPVVASDRVPAAVEIGGENVWRFSPDDSPQHVAQVLLEAASSSRALALRRKVRRELTWEALFHQQIQPLVEGRDAGSH